LDWLDSLMRAGEIARRVRARVPELVVVGARMLDVAERVEGLIRQMGGRPAFPCNISVDSVAAHYSPPPGDLSTIPPNSVVKIDFGVEVEGFIADTAITITDTATGEVLKTAVEEALKAALRVAAANVKVSAIGAVVQSTLARYGVKPIKNLTGHEIQRYNLHAGVSIPNVAAGDDARLVEGHVYAVEPFATVAAGSGVVVDASPATIFRLNPRQPTRKTTPDEEGLLKNIEERFNGLPYSLRWLKDLGDINMLHQRFVKTGRVKAYPLLVEKTGKPVAQAEHTILVERDGCTVVT
jgi:methionyl aminopeptidase